MNPDEVEVYKNTTKDGEIFPAQVANYNAGFPSYFSWALPAILLQRTKAILTTTVGHYKG